jgi:Fungal specific transcription factor domain
MLFSPVMAGWSLSGGPNDWIEPKHSPPRHDSVASGASPSSGTSGRGIDSSTTSISLCGSGTSTPADKTALDKVRDHYKGSTTIRSPLEHESAAPSASLVQLYYSFFHGAHPFVLPPQFLIKRTHQFPQLMAVMLYVGACYAPNGPREKHRKDANLRLFIQNVPENGFTVQAILLFAIALHSNNEQEEATSILTKGIDIALKIGMNTKSFAVDHGEGDKVLEESWRRTWWELYYIDGLIAGVHQRTTFSLFAVPTDVPLPCEEVDYVRGVCSRIPLSSDHH